MSVLVVGKNRFPRSAADTSNEHMCGSFIKDNQPIMQTTHFQYTMVTLPRLTLVIETIQIKIQII